MTVSVSEGDGRLRLSTSIREAARLRLEMIPFEQDRVAIGRGEKIFYCIDSNIVSLYLDPHKMGVESGYGVVFSSENEEISAALGAALSRYILFLLAGDSASHLPLILLPGHMEEVRRQYDNLNADLPRSLDRKVLVNDQIRRRENIRLLLQSDSDPDQLVDKIYGLIYSATNELTKLGWFNSLLMEGRVRALVNLGQPIAEKILRDDRSSEAIARARSAANAPSTIHEMLEESKYRTSWTTLLANESRARSPRRLRADALALGRLQIVNRKLEEFGARLVLITGDEAMHRACAKVPLENGKTFADCYIRHPRAFLASRFIIARPEHSRTDGQEKRSIPASEISDDFVVNWIDGLLARFMDYEGPKEGYLAKVTSNGPLSGTRIETEEAADFADQIEKTWGSFGQLLRQQHTATSEAAREEIRRILPNGYDDIERHLIEVDRALVRKSQAYWQSFLDANVDAGYTLALGDERIRRKRNAPPTYYERFARTNDFVRTALTSPSQYDLRADLRDALQAIDDEEPFGYAKMLAFATLHASHGNWYVARLLANRAIAIVEGIRTREIPLSAEGEPLARTLLREDIGPKLTGREAYYFAAVACRNMARRSEGLAEVYQLLDLAEGALDEDIRIYKVDEPDLKRLRFKRERLATDLSAYLFDHFHNGLPDVDHAQQREDLLHRLVECLQQTDPPSTLWFKPIMRRSIIANILMINALKETTEKAFDEEFFRRLARELTELDALQSRDLPIPIEIMSLYARARFLDPSRSERKRILDEVNEIEFLLTEDPSSICAMPYDKSRYRYLLDLSRQQLHRG